MLESKQLYLEKVRTSENGVDMLTKSLPKQKKEACRPRAGLVEPTSRRGRFVGPAHLWARE